MGNNDVDAKQLRKLNALDQIDVVGLSKSIGGTDA